MLVDEAPHVGRAVRNRVPQPVSGELVRAALVERLQQRFSSPVTTVIAGAGFGKTTVLAQAVRHNLAGPLGIDAWVTCRPEHERADELAGSLREALGDDRAGRGPAMDALVSAVVALSPLDVCLVVDDCQLVPAGSSAEQLLASLVRNLPSNGHLLLAGRRLPDVPLARLKAAGACTMLGAADLRFSPGEVAAVAGLLDRDPAPAGELGGWPALVRLALVARSGTDRQYLREEVLAELPERMVRTLGALVVLGPSDDDDVGRVAEDAVRLEELAERAPLIATTGDGVCSAHQLWEEAVLAAVPAGELAGLRARAHDVLLERGALARAGGVAIAGADWPALGRTAVRLVSRAPTALPVDTVRRWLAAAPADADVPALRLLDAAARYMHDARDPDVESAVDEVLMVARAAGDVHLEAAATTVSAIVAHSRRDLARLLELSVRATELAGQVDDPIHDLLVGSLPAVRADLAGDPDGVLAALAGVPWDRLPADVGRTAQHLRLQALWQSGRAAESVALADEWFGEPGTYLPGVPWLSRWLAGDPSGVAPWDDHRGPAPVMSARDQFVGGCLVTYVHACRGDLARIEQIWSTVPMATAAFDNARDSAHVTCAGAARALSQHDEAAAAECFRVHLARHPLTDALGERHLRRWPALGYVLSPELRAHWDAVELGPAHAMARRCGRALLAARDGRVEEAPTDPELHTQLPLVWSIELAWRWHALGSPRGASLVDFLIDATGPAARAELEAADCPGAISLLRALPKQPADHLAIDVLGPLTLRRDGADVHEPLLRRQRVRQLLAVLVAERTVRRDRVLDLLWPERSPAAASTNLRVTLTHLRRVLEPDRRTGDTGFHLRADGTSITLRPSEHLAVDLWRLEAIHAEVDRAAGEPHRLQQLLAEATALWRGEPLSDLADVEGFEAMAAHLHRRHTADLLRLGELHVAAGQPAAALDCAERVLAVDAYREQAHRLAIAALQQLDDAPGVAGALGRLDEALAEVGTDAEPATEILRRQAIRRYGARVGAERAGAQPPDLRVTTAPGG